MPKIIQTLCEVVPEEGLLVRSSYLRNNIKATKLVHEAQRRAKAIVLDAQAQAESIVLAAKVQGYSAGICAAAAHLVQYLNEHEERTVQIQEKLEEHTRLLLQRCVTNPEVVMSTLAQCLSEQTPQVSARLDLVLPENFRLHHRSLMERIAKIHHGHIKVEYWPEGRFILRLGVVVPT